NSTRDYFQAHVAADAGTFIGAPLVPRVGDGVIFTVSRRRPAAGTEFAGVIAAALSPRRFEDFYRSIDERPESHFGLLRADGTYLARHPELPAPGMRLDPRSSFRRLIAEQPQGGLYTTVSGIDGVERRFAVRRVAGYPLYVSAGTETTAIWS